MKNYRLYTYTSVIFLALFGVLSVLSIPLIVKQYTSLFLEVTYDNLNKKAENFVLVQRNLSSKEDFTVIAQKVIQGTKEDLGFISIIDWTGNYVCYPDVTKLGETIPEGKTADFGGEINGEKLYNYYFNYFNTLKDDVDYEIIKVKTLEESDYILVYNLNLREIVQCINLIKGRTYLTFVILGMFMLLVLLAITRIVSFNSNKLLEEKVSNLEINTQSLAKLNESIVSYQQKIENSVNTPESTFKEEDEEIEEVSKLRILTYVRNELVSIKITDIAYIYVESTITYIIRKDGKMATSNDSLDKIFSVLDKNLFFKTNRQFVVAISAIEKITKFENNKLKIQVNPKSEIDIIIGKNKASAFKQWLDL